MSGESKLTNVLSLSRPCPCPSNECNLGIHTDPRSRFVSSKETQFFSSIVMEKPTAAIKANKHAPISMDHVLAASRETKEEREARIRRLFRSFDTKNVGHVGSAQIQSGLSAMRVPADYKFAKELLQVCDANQDDKVDYQEFRKYMDDKELELYRIFQAIDVEHNGCIAPEELWDALVKAGIILTAINHSVSSSFTFGNRFFYFGFVQCCFVLR